MGKWNWIAAAAFGAAISASGSARAEPVAVDQLHKAFAAAAKTAGIKQEIHFNSCSDADGLFRCRYSAAPATVIEAHADAAGQPIAELAAYLPPIKRSGIDASALLTIFFRTFSPTLTPQQAGVALKTLVNDAVGRERRGEVRLKGATYVLRPADGTAVRIYVTIDE